MKNYIELYNNIIEQWSKKLYTPKQLLQYLTNYFVKYNKNNFMLKISFFEILKIINLTTYRYSKQFLKVINEVQFLKEKYKIKSLDDFINIGICDAYNKNSIQNMIGKNNSNNFFNKDIIYNTFKNDDFPDAESFKRHKSEPLDIFLSGCKIILNRNSKTNFNNYAEVEKLIDHQFNHFFTLLDEQLNDKFPSLEKYNQCNQIAESANFIINTDFIKHMYLKSQFISMCSDTCNNIEIYMLNTLKNKLPQQIFQLYQHLCTKEIILSNEFLKYSNNMQNSILFGYICKQLDQKRWNFLCQYIKEQLNIK